MRAPHHCHEFAIVASADRRVQCRDVHCKGQHEDQQRRPRDGCLRKIAIATGMRRDYRRACAPDLAAIARFRLPLHERRGRSFFPQTSPSKKKNLSQMLVNWTGHLARQPSKMATEGAMPVAAQPMQAQQSAESAVVDVESSEPSAAGPKVRTPQIHWHGKSPVFAIDFHPHFASLCVTGGLEPDGTGGVHLWIVNEGEKADKAPVSFVQGLEGHEKAVNCLRFCPKGDLLASAGVEGIVIIWRRTAVAPSPSAAVAGHEKWEFLKMLRAHTLDVADLSWSPSCTQLATASVDHTAVVFNLRPNKEKVGAHIRGHVDYALGVAWDPKEEYILTTSSDGSTRMHVSKSGKWKADARTLKIADRMEFPKKNDNRSVEPDVQSEGLKGSTGFKMFVDGTLAGGFFSVNSPAVFR